MYLYNNVQERLRSKITAKRAVDDHREELLRSMLVSSPGIMHRRSASEKRRADQLANAGKVSAFDIQ